MGVIRVTEKKIAEWIKEGRGSGTGANYKPWIRVEDSKSGDGVQHRIHGYKTNRTYDLLSNVEHGAFVLLDWNPFVIDIQEQFPWDRKDTQTVAMDLGIPHQEYPGSRIPYVMSADFRVLLRMPSGEKTVVWNCKVDEEIEDEGSMCHLEIQRELCSRLGTLHYVVTPSCFPEMLTKNLISLYDAPVAENEIIPYPGYYEHWKKVLARAFGASNKSDMQLNDFCSEFEEANNIEEDDALRIARMLLHERVLIAELSQMPLHEIPISDFRVRNKESFLKLVGS